MLCTKVPEEGDSSGEQMIPADLPLWEKQVKMDDSYLTVKLIFQTGSHPVLLRKINFIVFFQDYT